MNKKYLFLILFFITISNSFAQKYKQMMYDNKVNFYDVVTEAENYFKTHDKNKKGSGWKGYQRWKYDNEAKYYPSGDRSTVDPYFVKNSYNAFLKKNSITQETNRILTNGWNELGPSTITTLTNHYGPGLGRVEDFYVDPANADKMYLGSKSGGFWKTLDGGTTWVGTTDFLVASGVNTIGVSPTNADVILINVRNSQNGTSHGIYSSTDGGNTWVETNFNPTNLGQGGLGSNWTVNQVAYHPTIANLVFVASSDGLYRSDNNLATWTKVFDEKCKEIRFHPTDANKMYFYNNSSFKNQVQISNDAGLTFYTSQLVVGNNDSTKVHLSVSSACPDCLYWASGNGIWKSTDQGENFTFISNPDVGSGGFTVSDTDNTKMIIGYVDVSASTDDGVTFNQVTYWGLGNDGHDVAGDTNQSVFDTSTKYIHADLHPAKCINGVFYVGTDGFFSRSTDNGITWEKLNQGVGIRENYRLGVSQSNAERSISGSQDNGSSIKTENGWIEFYGGDGMEGIIHPLNDNWMISSAQYGARRRTKDGGLSVAAVSPNGTGSDAAWAAPIAYDPNNQKTVYDFRTSVFKSETFGRNWINVGTPSFNDKIRVGVIAQNDSNIMIATAGANIEKSIDGGATWSSIRGTLPNYTVQNVAFDPNNDDTIIVVYSKYQNDNEKVFISTDAGTTWTNITYNLGNMPIRSVVIDHTADANIYLGAEIGLYTKPMNGNTWTLYNTNLPNSTIKDLEIVYGSNTIKAATWGRGLWECALIGRADYPKIITTSITNPPTNDLPKEDIYQNVTSTIEYSGTLTNVEVKWSVDNLNFDNTIPMSNTTGNNWVTDYPIPNYLEGSKIYFKVFATGDNNDTTETYKFMYKVKSSPYCVSEGTGTDLEITNVSITDILDNTSDNTSYIYYNTPVTQLEIGQSYEISITANTNLTDNDYGVWIDYNNNYVFDMPEQILLSTNQSANTVSAQFTVPVNAVLNQTRMRVNLSSSDNMMIPCSIELGEVEDYAININADTTTPVFDIQNLPDINSQCSLTSITTIPTATDAVTGSITGTTNTTLPITESTTITWTYDDGNGNSITQNQNVVITPIDNTVNQTDNVLTANASGYSYQWLDCDNANSYISGETNQTFTASENGNYAVEITTNNCQVVSDCITVNSLAVISNSVDTNISIYPNPFNETISIDGVDILTATIKIYSILGQKIDFNIINQNTIILNKLVSGVYILNIANQNFIIIKK